MGGRLDPAVDILTWLTDHGVHATIFPTGKATAETAIGQYPEEAVRAMDRIARELEGQRQSRGVTSSPGLYTLGRSWQHTRGSALLGWVGDDAAFLAERIAARTREGG